MGAMKRLLKGAAELLKGCSEYGNSDKTDENPLSATSSRSSFLMVEETSFKEVFLFSYLFYEYSLSSF